MIGAKYLVAAAFIAGYCGPLACVRATAAAPAGAGATHPDFSGVWQIADAPQELRTTSGDAPPLLPSAQAVYLKHLLDRKSGDTGYDPMNRCLPPGVPRILLRSLPFLIQQQPRLIAMIFQWNHLYRLIYLDTGHFEAVSKSYLGQSIGKWTGQTLTVDSNDFNAATLLDDSGLPHGDGLHVIERYTLRNGGSTLEDRITIEDPETFTKPWETVLRFRRRSVRVRDDDYCLGRIGKEPMNLK